MTSSNYRFMIRKVVNGHFMLFSWSGWVPTAGAASWLSSEQAQIIQGLYGGEIL